MFALEELGLPYELEAVPDGTFYKNWGSPGPTLQDDDVFVIEPAAILRHVARRSGKLWPTSLVAQAEGDRWIDFLQRRLVRAFDANEPMKLANLLSFVDQKVSPGAWILGAELTIVDCLYAYLGQDFAKGRIPWDNVPALTAYVARLDAQPALIRANEKTPR